MRCFVVNNKPTPSQSLIEEYVKFLYRIIPRNILQNPAKFRIDSLAEQVTRDIEFKKTQSLNLGQAWIARDQKIHISIIFHPIRTIPLAEISVAAEETRFARWNAKWKRRRARVLASKGH